MHNSHRISWGDYAAAQAIAGTRWQLRDLAAAVPVVVGTGPAPHVVWA
jgi:hypothetical protein